MTGEHSTTVSSARLLVIEREPAAARSTIAAFGGCFVSDPTFLHARAGRDASDHLRAAPFDLVLADLSSIGDLSPSPEDAIVRLAKLGNGALTIVLTSEASVSAMVAAMRAGAHDVIGKPLEPATLAERIGRLCQRHGKSLGLVVDGVEAMPAAAHPAVLGVNHLLAQHQVLPMWRQEQKIIEEAIATFSGNIALAAAALELSPSTIYRKRQAWAEMETGRKGAA
jgi:DNA-binding NtrC family response regulator